MTVKKAHKKHNLPKSKKNKNHMLQLYKNPPNHPTKHKHNTNMSSSSSSFVDKLRFTLAFLLSLQTSFSNNPQALDVEATECEARLLLLLPCMTFVQGLVNVPSQLCCDNLADVYIHHPTCLCSLLNESTTTINHTLAMRLPPLCNVAIKASRCATSTSEEAPSPKASQLDNNEGNLTNSSANRPCKS